MENITNQKYKIETISNSPELKVRYQSASGFPKGSIIFVHGICHGAWCFENFMDFFSENGYECFALNLRGHGDNNRKGLTFATLSQYESDVKECVEYCINYCSKNGVTEKPFLLGHSMGGAVVQKYIGEYTNTVKGAILFASATAGGMDFWKTIKDGFTHKNLFFAILVGLGLSKKMKIDSIWESAFFDKRIGHEKARIYKEKLCRESLIILFHDLYKEYTNNNDIYIPILVVGSCEDSYFKEESLITTADAYKCSKNDTKKKLEILSNLCHDMMLDEVDEGWKKSVKVVLDFMENNK
jgi:Lysophospholipase